VYTKRATVHRLILGSGNLTRRNLDNYNLETDVDIQASATNPLLQQFQSHFEEQWNNEKSYTKPYEDFADESLLKTLQYRFMEASGIGTF